ncbi:MAG: DUF488 family protein [Nitrosopumilus sp.]|nr:DUF488 family protein [Nitrosopumilus sp.]
MIRTKSIYEPKEELDDLRILITRFYPRGIKKTHFDLWKKELAPSKQLLKDYKTKKKTWEEFTESFQSELKDQKESIETIKDLKIKAKSNNITLLCYEKEGESCHRHLLKKLLENPKFETKI